MSSFLLEPHDTALWVAIAIALVLVALVCIKWLATQPFFGGGTRPKDSLTEHYIHGDITTEEYEDRKSHPRFT